MKTSLVLTLGHNSSAIVVRDGHIFCGFEEERLTQKKSDSSFPVQAIKQCMKYAGVKKFDDCYISHWFTAGLLIDSKYYDSKSLASIVDGPIHSVTKDFTHHDAHMHSALAFADYYKVGRNNLIIVADGFGTFGENLTIYHRVNNSISLKQRVFGYHNSLGLLYQYATAYLGMKMHNHEYKMLGYEAHIRHVLDDGQIDLLDSLISIEAERRVREINSFGIEKDTDPVCSTAALSAVQFDINQRLAAVEGLIEEELERHLDQYSQRVVIAYFVQGVVEEVMIRITRAHVCALETASLIVAGGLFYNVKLNHRLADITDELCVMPLAGDQGAGLGVYHAHEGLTWPGHLFWGLRDLNTVPKIAGIHHLNENEALDYLDDVRRPINVVRGAMEFGPRSLCHTATLAQPTHESVMAINQLNDRTTVMPMAPVMTEAQCMKYLNHCAGIVGSLEYMVVTRTVDRDLGEEIAGAAHYYDMHDKYTCRPQITREPFMIELLKNGPLINTSFNFHGEPILYSVDQIVKTHASQNCRGNIETIVIKDEK